MSIAADSDGDETKIDPASIDLHHFMVGWRGKPDAPARRIAAEHQWLPGPLKAWYELTAQWTSPFMRLKRMLPAEKINATGKAVTFMTCPTGDWIWAFDLDEPHIVYERDLYGPWTRAAEDLPELLVHSALNEAIWNCPANQHGSVPPELVPVVIAGMAEVGFGGWQWPLPNTRVFLGEHTIAEVTPLSGERRLRQRERAGDFDVVIAATAPEHLDALDALQGVTWYKSATYMSSRTAADSA